VTPPYFFEDPLAEVETQKDHFSAGTFDDFCASRDGLALMRAFVKIKDQAMRHRLAKLVEGLVD
jgi:hypothetical protein